MVELKLVNIVTKLELEICSMLMFTVGVKVFLSCLVMWFPCRICTKELQILVVPKVVTMLLQLIEQLGKINERISLRWDLNSTIVIRGSLMLFVVTVIYPSLIWTGEC